MTLLQICALIAVFAIPSEATWEFQKYQDSGCSTSLTSSDQNVELPLRLFLNSPVQDVLSPDQDLDALPEGFDPASIIECINGIDGNPDGTSAKIICNTGKMRISLFNGRDCQEYAKIGFLEVKTSQDGSKLMSGECASVTYMRDVGGEDKVFDDGFWKATQVGQHKISCIGAVTSTAGTDAGASTGGTHSDASTASADASTALAFSLVGLVGALAMHQ